MIRNEVLVSSYTRSAQFSIGVRVNAHKASQNSESLQSARSIKSLFSRIVSYLGIRVSNILSSSRAGAISLTDYSLSEALCLADQILTVAENAKRKSPLFDPSSIMIGRDGRVFISYKDNPSEGVRIEALLTSLLTEAKAVGDFDLVGFVQRRDVILNEYHEGRAKKFVDSRKANIAKLEEQLASLQIAISMRLGSIDKSTRNKLKPAIEGAFSKYVAFVSASIQDVSGIVGQQRSELAKKVREEALLADIPEGFIEQLPEGYRFGEEQVTLLLSRDEGEGVIFHDEITVVPHNGAPRLPEVGDGLGVALGDEGSSQTQKSEVIKSGVRQEEPAGYLH